MRANKRLNVLIGGETSGVIRDAFRKRGHNAWSCDLLPCEESPFEGYHLHGDVRNVLHGNIPKTMNRRAPSRITWDVFIMHPDCTYLCSSGLHWNKRGILVDGRPRAQLTEEALQFVRDIMAAPIACILVENPRGCIGTRIDAMQYGFTTQKATQTIQPYQYGHDASKTTDLWLKGIEPITPTKYVEPRCVCVRCSWVGHKRAAREAFSNGCPQCGQEPGKLRPRWANQTDSGQNRLSPSDHRWQQRSRTYDGIGEAIADQVGGNL